MLAQWVRFLFLHFGSWGNLCFQSLDTSQRAVDARNSDKSRLPAKVIRAGQIYIAFVGLLTGVRTLLLCPNHAGSASWVAWNAG